MTRPRSKSQQNPLSTEGVVGICACVCALCGIAPVDVPSSFSRTALFSHARFLELAPCHGPTPLVTSRSDEEDGINIRCHNLCMFLSVGIAIHVFGQWRGVCRPSKQAARWSDSLWFSFWTYLMNTMGMGDAWCREAPTALCVRMCLTCSVLALVIAIFA